MKNLNKIVLLDENTIEAYERCTCVDWCWENCNTYGANYIQNDSSTNVVAGYPKASMGGLGCI